MTTVGINKGGRADIVRSKDDIYNPTSDLSQ